MILFLKREVTFFPAGDGHHVFDLAIIGTFKIQRRRRQQERQKGFISKTTTLHVHHAFCTFLYLLFHDYDVKMPNFAFYRVRKQATTKLYFSF